MSFQRVSKRPRPRPSKLLTVSTAPPWRWSLAFPTQRGSRKSFSSNRAELRDVIAKIQPTQHTTNLLEALRQAAGLANPSRQAFVQNENQVQARSKDEAAAEALPATIYIMSDGRFPDVQGFSLGNLKPVYVPIGEPTARNAGITAFSVRRKDEKADELQAFAQIENPGKAPLTFRPNSCAMANSGTQANSHSRPGPRRA